VGGNDQRSSGSTMIQEVEEEVLSLGEPAPPRVEGKKGRSRRGRGNPLGELSTILKRHRKVP